MSETRIAILGAGPAGLGAAWQLARQGKAKAVVLEQRDDVGGNAGSFELDGLQVDFGSHRLHPSCEPRILDDLRGLLGYDLLDRPRHGRIRLGGKWIHFPLKPADLMLNLPWSFRVGVAWDSLKRAIPGSGGGNGDTFASVLEQGLGGTICREFYFPYTVKIWGVSPEVLSPIQAHKRVSAGSLMKMVKKILGLKVHSKTNKPGRFYYPRKGFGQISRSIAEAAKGCGAEVRLNTAARKITLGSPHRIETQTGGKAQTIEADYLWSTVPLAVLPRLISGPVPAEVTEAARHNESRAMVLIYLVLEQEQFTPFDAHYFPGADIRITRLSEPKNYCVSPEPRGRTILCAELPCAVGDEYWEATNDALGEVVKDSLARCDLPIRSRVLRCVAMRLPHAYPIYRMGYERHFEVLDRWASGLDHVLSFGRQGLFAHDNTHHALAMAYAAVDCLSQDGVFDQPQWARYREHFNSHVVED